MMYADNMCTYTEILKPRHGYVFTGKCFLTKKTVSVFVPGDELFKYRQGALIQEALVSVSPSDREFLMSGISSEGWDKTFKDEEEE